MLINGHWLKKNINKKNIKILDASWYLPNLKRSAKQEFKKKRIPGSIFFDIDDICDNRSRFPHMLPSKRTFEDKISRLGISFNDTVIIYCNEGVMSSPRVWWMFKYFGHKKVFILDGGIKAWCIANGRLISSKPKSYRSSYKTGRINLEVNSTFDDIIYYRKKKQELYIVDARPKRRFLELEAEPRENVGKGKIEGSLNLEFSLLDRKGFLKRKSEVREIFKNILKKEYKVILTCGSGVSACSLAFSLNYIGRTKWSVYDGSWTEWYLRTKN